MRPCTSSADRHVPLIADGVRRRPLRPPSAISPGQLQDRTGTGTGQQPHLTSVVTVETVAGKSAPIAHPAAERCWSTTGDLIQPSLLAGRGGKTCDALRMVMMTTCMKYRMTTQRPETIPRRGKADWLAKLKRLEQIRLMTDIDARSALLTLLKEMALEPDMSLSLYEIGPPLIGQGISQDSIVDALYALKDEGVINLPGNRLELLKVL